jgi:hypothetical protein
MAVTNKPVPIPREREGYGVTYGGGRGYSGSYAAPLAVNNVEYEPFWRRIQTEERLGLLTFGGGLIWTTKVETVQISNIFHLLMTPGPLELSAIGLLIWIHAKWRRSVRVR